MPKHEFKELKLAHKTANLQILKEVFTTEFMVFVGSQMTADGDLIHQEKSQGTNTTSVQQGSGCCPSVRLRHESIQSSESRRCIPSQITKKNGNLHEHLVVASTLKKFSLLD